VSVVVVTGTGTGVGKTIATAATQASGKTSGLRLTSATTSIFKSRS